MTNTQTTLTAKTSTLMELLEPLAQEVRADQLLLGDVLLLPTWDDQMELKTVRTLALLNCDVEVNGDELMTSRSNTLMVVGR